MTSQSSGGSGSGLPGVTSDGLTPGGEIVAGKVVAGDATAADTPSFHRLNGYTRFQDTPGNNVDADDVVDINQTAPLANNAGVNALFINRSGALNGFDYTSPALYLVDTTASTAPLAAFNKGGTNQFQVDSDGVQVHGKFKTGASVTHTASVLSGKCVPIYDEAGTLLGYMPLYN